MDTINYTSRQGATVSVSASQTSANTALALTEGAVLVTNLGTNRVYIGFGTASVTATTAMLPILAGTQVKVFCPQGTTNIGIVCATGETATVLLTPVGR